MTTNATPITDTEEFLKLSSDQLDDIFRASPAGPIPVGQGEGTAIIAPGTVVSDPVARFIHISNLHALGHALAASGTLHEFCIRLERYYRIITVAAVATITEQAEELRLSFEHLAQVCGETEDAMLGFVVLSMRQLGEAWIHLAGSNRFREVAGGTAETECGVRLAGCGIGGG